MNNNITSYPYLGQHYFFHQQNDYYTSSSLTRHFNVSHHSLQIKRCTNNVKEWFCTLFRSVSRLISLNSTEFQIDAVKES